MSRPQAEISPFCKALINGDEPSEDVMESILATKQEVVDKLQSEHNEKVKKIREDAQKEVDKLLKVIEDLEV